MAALVACAAACSEDPLPPTPPPPPPALPVIAIVSGDQQEATLGETLANLLVVRVRDANGAAAPGVLVLWKVAIGSGQFGAATPQTTTGVNGTTAISFRPTGANDLRVIVSAEVAGEKAPVFFNLHAVPGSVPLTVRIPYGPIFDCTESQDPSLFQAPQGTIPVGALVEWEYAAWLYPTCASLLRSVVVPPGVLPFESGPIHPGEHFAITLNAPGDWVVADAMFGGQVTLRVR